MDTGGIMKKIKWVSKPARFFLFLLVWFSLIGFQPITQKNQDDDTTLQITLIPGEPYFRLDGIPRVIFMRNIAGYGPEDYISLIKGMSASGSQVVRLQIPTTALGGTGYKSDGSIDEAWAQKWELVLSAADKQGVGVFLSLSGWLDWNNRNEPRSDWSANPMNAVNGGPALTTHDLYIKDSKTQKLLFEWMGKLVDRWKEHRSILIWEPYSEINLGDHVTEEEAITFTTKSAEIIRKNDPYSRPITVSLADFGDWKKFYANPALDFINIHPYPVSGRIDLKILEDIPRLRNQYKKPVMIGESGLDFKTPDTSGTLTLAENARGGLQHAVWAGVVSGSMNARSFWWEDGVGLYFPSLGWAYVWKNDNLEKAASNFVQGLDMTGFEPIPSSHRSAVTGAVLGTESSMIGWFRDSACEPPQWKTDRVISGQRVELSLPASRVEWTVDFIDTRNGQDILSSQKIIQNGTKLSIPLPDFRDDIAFKLRAGNTSGAE